VVAKRKKMTTTNTTLLRLKDTPFKTATEMNTHEERICREEWELIERAKQRRRLLRKTENADVIAPFTNGFGAKFIGHDQIGNLVKVYLTPNDQIQIDIDDKLRTKDAAATVECLVRSLSESFVNGYLSALGLKDESILPTSPSAASIES
jgi:2',3'-cyclic-nucleotide 2'-phosphodiesterase (5'-nucleotidase family)